MSSVLLRMLMKLFGTCPLLSSLPLFLPHPPSPRLEVYHLCKKNSSFRPPSPTNSRRNCHTDVSVGGRRTSLRVAPRSLCWAFLKLHRFNAEVTPHDCGGVTVDLHYLHSLIFEFEGERFVNVAPFSSEGPPCFGAAMNGSTESRLSSNPFFHLISSRCGERWRGLACYSRCSCGVLRLIGVCNAFQ